MNVAASALVRHSGVGGRAGTDGDAEGVETGDAVPMGPVVGDVLEGYPGVSGAFPAGGLPDPGQHGGGLGPGEVVAG